MFLGTMRSTKSRNSTNFAMINGARQPPRPTPSMVNYSDEDSAKGYDENPDDSDSLTEKPSEISSTDSQVRTYFYRNFFLSLDSNAIFQCCLIRIFDICQTNTRPNLLNCTGS